MFYNKAVVLLQPRNWPMSRSFLINSILLLPVVVIVIYRCCMLLCFKSVYLSHVSHMLPLK